MYCGDLKVNSTTTITVGPALDDDDAVTQKTGTLADTDFYLSKNGGAKANPNDTNDATHDADGVHLKQLDGTDLNTEGLLTVYMYQADILYIRQDYTVLSVAAYNSKYTAKDDGYMDVNLKAISEDETAADNLEAMFDTTGYTEDSAPATQEQIGRLTSGSAAINTTAKAADDGFVITTGADEANDEDSTHALDSATHDLEDNGGTTDCYYIFNIGGNGSPVSITWSGYVNAQGDSFAVYACTDQTDISNNWEQIGTISGIAGSTIQTNTYTLTTAHVGTGDHLGNVLLRFYSTDGTKVATDRIICSYAVVTKSAGYANGSIWYNDSAANTNTEAYVDGTADNPISTWTAYKALSASLGIKTVTVANGSTVTPDATCANISFLGHDWILALNSQVYENAHIEEAAVSGTGTAGAGEIHLNGCHIGDATLEKTHACCCALEGTITISDAETYIFHDCFAADTGGATPPEIDYNDVEATVGIRDWTGGLKVKTMAAACKLTVQGKGKLTIDATCDDGGTIGIQGNMELVDGVGPFGGTVNDDGRVDVGQINAEVLDVMNVDTHAEPGQGAPAATASVFAKINYLYKAWRNKSTQNKDTGVVSLYNDAEAVVDQKGTNSDDGTTFTKDEIGSGP